VGRGEAETDLQHLNERSGLRWVKWSWDQALIGTFRRRSIVLIFEHAHEPLLKVYPRRSGDGTFN
jgi:hypothetical protein